jgi:hypothetical protein
MENKCQIDVAGIVKDNQSCNLSIVLPIYVFTSISNPDFKRFVTIADRKSGQFSKQSNFGTNPTYACESLVLQITRLNPSQTFHL